MKRLLNHPIQSDFGHSLRQFALVAEQPTSIRNRCEVSAPFSEPDYHLPLYLVEFAV